MKILYAILILDLGLLVWANGDFPPVPGESTNDWTQAISPPLPVDSSGGGDLSNAVYQASLRPSPRVLMSDGQIITWTVDAIEWHIEAPYYKVEWCSNLVEHNWHIIGFRRGAKFSHNAPEGFYRVTSIKEPTDPPTYPAQRHPTNSFPTVVAGNGGLYTGANARGFKK